MSIFLKPRLIRQINEKYWQECIKNKTYNCLVYKQNYENGLKKTDYFLDKIDDLYIKKTCSYFYVDNIDNNGSKEQGFVTETQIDNIIDNTRPDQVIIKDIIYKDTNTQQISVVYIESFSL